MIRIIGWFSAKERIISKGEASCLYYSEVKAALVYYADSLSECLQLILLPALADFEYLPAKKHNVAAVRKQKRQSRFLEDRKLACFLVPLTREYLGPDLMSDSNIVKTEDLHDKGRKRDQGMKTWKADLLSSFYFCKILWANIVIMPAIHEHYRVQIFNVPD